MNKNSKLYIAGHTGLVGSAILRKYTRKGYKNILTKSKSELNLISQQDVNEYFKHFKPEHVIIAAALVGGIQANMTYPSEFIYENLMIQNNVIWAAHRHGVAKLLFISCGCAYPSVTKQPMSEDAVLTGLPEVTNEGFALAKIAGMKLCEKITVQYGKNFIACIPANTYGENDHFDEQKSHVIPALIKRFYEAKAKGLETVTLWGTGNARREFIYVDDLADAVFLLMEEYNNDTYINVGSGEEVTIRELANIIKETVGFTGKIIFDLSKPDGTSQRILDSSKIKKIGFQSKTTLKEGIKKALEYYLRLTSEKK